MITYHRDSIEYVTCTVTEASGADLTGLPVDISLSRGSVHTWLPARWVDGKAQTVAPVTFDAASWPEAGYSVCVRVTANPETIIALAGSLMIEH